ncbi:MAG: alpha/beta hydrolase [Candidatus Rokubacteria bacterium]|nr:alpha/beta hydrolase [Candidatus Rokubacteria bacterium]MBI3825081.1 alpha/beta hydrolase [Candidatus Rokubacteria bacterium]
MARGKLSSATFVLVHGAWHGGWCWARVARMLRDVGHTVHTPTLTGLGERAHLARPDVDLALHVQDVVALIEAEELRQVILVGHSYGGMVITGVAAHAGGRLAHLVYLDAFVPSDGQSLLGLVGEELAAGVRAAAREHGEGWRIPPFPPERFGVTNPKDVEWLTRHLVPQPLQTFEQGVQAKDRPSLKRSYIYCAKPAMGAFDRYAALKSDRGWRYHELATGHDAMVTAAPDLAKILADSAG